MKPNNLIYRSIANKITGITFEKFYSSMYYMRAIAEYYNGEPYTGRKPSNKYIKDWYIGLTGESEPETHKYNLWYLREIVKFYDPQQSGLNENQCLSFIDDQIEPPSPVEFDSISLTATPDVLSYADGDTATLTAQLMNGQEEAHLSGKSVSFDIVDGQGTVLSHIGDGVTDANGVAVSDNDYVSRGVGDVSITARVGMIVSETYAIQDGLFADTMIDSVKSSWSNTGLTLSSDSTGTTISHSANSIAKMLYNLNNDNCIVEFDYISGTGNDLSFGFRVENSSNAYSMYCGYYSTRYRYGANTGSEKSITKSAPSNNHMKFEITPTSHKFYIDDVLIEEVNPSNSTTSKYIGFYLSYANSSMKIKNFIIKPL